MWLLEKSFIHYDNVDVDVHVNDDFDVDGGHVAQANSILITIALDPQGSLGPIAQAHPLHIQNHNPPDNNSPHPPKRPHHAPPRLNRSAISGGEIEILVWL